MLSFYIFAIKRITEIESSRNQVKVLLLRQYSISEC